MSKKKQNKRQEKKPNAKLAKKRKEKKPGALNGIGLETAAPSDEYDPTGAIHEAVLAAKETRSPKLRLNKVQPVVVRVIKPPLSIEQILVWADSYYARTEMWPRISSGTIPESPGDTWKIVDVALRLGFRGMPGGSSLCALLLEKRGALKGVRRPALSIEKILQWADAYYERTNRWPNVFSGPIAESPANTWTSVCAAFEQGLRGLPKGMTLATLLEERRGKRHKNKLFDYTEEQILDWADAHRERTLRWPKANSGPVVEASGETWNAVETALRNGCRGLPGGSSLCRLLEKHRGERNLSNLPQLEVNTILAWADACYARTNAWPAQSSGPVCEAPGEVWGNIDASLNTGKRGLPGGDSLARLLNRYRGKRNCAYPPRLDNEIILAWADAHFTRTKQWPTTTSGDIPEAPGDTWRGVSLALYTGRRGLGSKTTLARLLEARRGVVIGSSRKS